MPGRPSAAARPCQMREAWCVVRVQRQRHRATQGAEIQLQGFVGGCHGVRSLLEKSGQLRQVAEGSQSTNRNPPVPGSGRGGRMRRELSPGDSAMERQGTLHTRISADPAAGDQGLACSGPMSWLSVELSPGDSSINVHRHPLHRLAGPLTCWRAACAAARCAAWRLLVAQACPAAGMVAAARSAQRVLTTRLSWSKR